MSFLEILGIAFLIIVLVAAYYGWKVYRFFKRSVLPSSPLMQLLSILPAATLDLEKISRSDWLSKEKLSSDEADLKRLGAEHEGYFEFFHGYHPIRISLWLFKKSIVVAFYETDPIEEAGQPSQYILELFAETATGSVCISNNPSSSLLPRQESDRIFTVDSDNVKQHLAALKAKLDGQKLKPLTTAKQSFIAAYEKHSEWVWQPVQLKSEQMQRLYASANIVLSDELFEQLLDIRASHTSELYSDKIIQKLAESGKFSAAQWEDMRERIVVVHEKLSLSDVSDLLFSYSDELSEAEEELLDNLSDRTDKADPVGCFLFHLQKLGVKAKLKRLGKVANPVNAVVFLAEE